MSLAIDVIRHCGADQLQLVRRLRAMLDDLRATLPPARADALGAELPMLTRDLPHLFPDAEDQGPAAQPDEQAISGSVPLAPRRARRNVSLSAARARARRRTKVPWRDTPWVGTLPLPHVAAIGLVPSPRSGRAAAVGPAAVSPYRPR